MALDLPMLLRSQLHAVHVHIACIVYVLRGGEGGGAEHTLCCKQHSPARF